MQRNSTPHRISDRYYDVLENRIPVQMGPEPIQANKQTMPPSPILLSLRLTG